MSEGFGLVPLRHEGAPIHPDDFPHYPSGVSDEEYLKQLQRYYDYHGETAMCTRPELLDKLVRRAE